MIFANLSDFLRFWVVFGLNLPDLGPKRWLEGPRAPIKPPGDHQGAQNVKMCCFLVPFWGPLGAQIGPRTAQDRFQNC